MYKQTNNFDFDNKIIYLVLKLLTLESYLFYSLGFNFSQRQKEGYILNPIQGEKGHFKAIKLGQIEIKVQYMCKNI